MTTLPPAYCNSDRGCGTVQVHEERLDAHEHRIAALEEDNKTLHKRMTDHLLDTINDMRGKLLLVITVVLSLAGLVVSVISMVRK